MNDLEVTGELIVTWQPPLIDCPKHGVHPYTMTIDEHEEKLCQMCWIDQVKDEQKVTQSETLCEQERPR